MIKRTIQLLISASLMTGMLWAADNPFVGDWKLNPSKSKLTDEMKVDSLGGNKYSFNLGGVPEIIVVDGTDQTGGYGTTLSVTDEGPNAWKVVRKKDGRVLVTGNWKLSKDGNTINDEFSQIAPNGSASTVNYVYQRKGSGSGFAGDWVSTSEAVNFDYVLQIRPYEEDGLSIINSSSQLTRHMKLDGKDYPNEGANATIITMSSLRRLDEHTLELTDKGNNGKALRTQEMKLSPDLKTLTMRRSGGRRDDADVFVFERQ